MNTKKSSSIVLLFVVHKIDFSTFAENDADTGSKPEQHLKCRMPEK